MLAALALCVWAALRVRRTAHTARRVWIPVVTVLTLAWAVAGAGGAEMGGVPVAAAPAAALISGQVEQVRSDLRDRARFEHALDHDAYAAAPARSLLTGLRGKDVLVVFVESYGRVATEGSWFAPQVQATLARDADRLATLGFASRSSYLRSPTFGGISWLAHSTLQSGLWVNSQQRYDDLLSSHRLTLAQAFHRAGWRTIADIPSNPHGWPQGQRFYHYDRMYGASDVGYHGPRFSYAEVPDQFTFAAFDRNVLAERHRRPVMAEIDLDSSHEPWTPLPHLIPWGQLGDGSVFRSMQGPRESLFQLLDDRTRLQRSYATSIRYSVDSLVSFVQHAHDKNLVMVVLGDHQPATVVSGIGGSHDVPISVIAHSPAVMRRIQAWGWTPGLLPGADQRARGMDSFRNRFFQAFGSAGTAP